MQLKLRLHEWGKLSVCMYVFIFTVFKLCCASQVTSIVSTHNWMQCAGAVWGHYW
jgi:hypothetical protein